MENQFFIDSGHLSPKALEKKHRLETDPAFRKNHMEYLPGMEQIESDVCEKVLNQVNTYDYTAYTRQDVRTALSHQTCSPEDFKALLSPAAASFWRKWHNGQDWKPAATLAIRSISSPRSTLPIIVKTTVYTAALTVITTFIA